MNEEVILRFSGHVDSGNAPEIEKATLSELSKAQGRAVTIDMEDLEYISSAGLRVILRIRKTHPDLKIINVRPEVYEILQMTGFTQMMTVEKAYRVVSVEGCEVIGQGANGKIYRIDKDNVVKVYKNADALSEIQHEREVARTALVLGIPTAISYDVVRVGDSYGSVFELLNARSFAKILANEPEKMDWCVKEYVALLHKIHSTVVPEGELPDIRETAISWGEFLKDYLPTESWEKLMSLIKAVPHDDHMIHGDYHTKNVELTGDEVLLIDMDTLAVGHPIFELGSMFNAFIGFSELDHEKVKQFQGFDFETSKTFWNKVLSAYLGTTNQKKIKQVEDKARVIGYTRMIRREIRRGGLERDDGKAKIAYWKSELLELLERIDTLLFTGNELTLDADVQNLQQVLGFINTILKEAGCPPKTRMQVDLAAEEIFVNIASYAYYPEKGKATLRVDVAEDQSAASLTFIDSGMPFDPLKNEDPDMSLSAEERSIGGLGVFLAKQTMDQVEYEYKDGKNILTLKKQFR